MCCTSLNRTIGRLTILRIICSTRDAFLHGILSAVSNIPAMIGLAAIAIVYVIYKKWNGEDVKIPTIESKKEEDPFTNFEKEWSNLTK